MSSATSVLIAVIVALGMLSVAHAHGMMCTPRQRAAYHTDKCETNLDFPGMDNMVPDFCPHCLNGGGKDTVTANLPPGGWSVYEPTKDFFATADRTGLCGDAKGSNEHMLGGHFMPYANVPMVSEWKKGQQVDLSVEIDTNHNGYFEFFICNLDACGKPDMDASCFVDNHCVKLNRVPHPSCENPSEATIHECGPIDAAYPGRWYVPCRKTAHVGIHIVGGDSGTMRYQLPADLECKHCILQWYWATANSCAPRGFKDYFVNYNFPFGTTCDSDGGARGTYSAGMRECGGDAVPEEFWSCADVQITADGSGAGSVPAPTDPNPQPASVPEENSAASAAGEDTEGESQDAATMASEASGVVPQEEVAVAGGRSQDCVALEQPCDGTRACCEEQSFCVYLSAVGGFQCRYWWTLAEQS